MVFRDTNLQEEEDVVCWQWHLSQWHRVVSRGRRSWDTPAVSAAQRAAPGKDAKTGLEICPFAHMGSACVCVFVCMQTTLNDLRVVYNLGTADLSLSSGPSPWNIHTAAKENIWKSWVVEPGFCLKMVFCHQDLRLKKGFKYWTCHDKNSVFRKGHFLRAWLHFLWVFVL